MKKFIIKSLLTICVFFTVYFIGTEICFYFLSSETLHKIYKQDWLTTKQRIDASKSKISNDTLYVGCSVSGQLLPFNHSNQLASNGSTYVIGNYFLIKNAISVNKNISTVIYLSVPDVIGHKLTRERTYNYFVKPFYTFENKKEIINSESTHQILKNNPSLPLCVFNSFKTLPIDDYDYSDNNHKRPDSLSNASIEWLLKIKSLCKSQNIRFHLASPPVATSRFDETNNWEIIRNQVKGTELDGLFNIYFKTIIYVDNKYLKDELHWKHDFINSRRADFIRRIMNPLSDSENTPH